MASKWETTNQQTAPAVIIPTRYGDIQQQSCVTGLFPMEVTFSYLNLKKKKFLNRWASNCTPISCILYMKKERASKE